MSMGRIWLVSVLLLVRVCAADVAEACSCPSRSASCGPPAEFWRATAVFSGRVAAVERVTDRPLRASRQLRIRVRVIQRFSGSLRESDAEVVLHTGPVCRYPFRTGHAYFIYAVRQDDGRLTTSVCAGTVPLERAAADLTYARSVVAGSAPPGRIVGYVRQLREAGSPGGPLSHVEVVADRRGTRLLARTDDRGRYTIEVPSAGTYVLNVALGGVYYTRHQGTRVEVPAPHACVQSNVDVRVNGQVAGRVVDGRGDGIAGITVLYTGSSSRTSTIDPPRSRAVTRDDGTYYMDQLAPGPFTVAVELAGNHADATVEAHASGRMMLDGSIPGGQRVMLPPLVVPSTVPIARVGGTVHTTDGAPAPGARVFLKSGDDEGHILGDAAIADMLGRFVLAALEGERYMIFAERAAPAGASHRPEFSEPIAVTVESRMAPLRLTLRRAP
jgi:hypothetical protein